MLCSAAHVSRVCLNNHLRYFIKKPEIFNLSNFQLFLQCMNLMADRLFTWQAEVCAGTVAEVIQSVVNGADGCVFCFGHSKLGKRQTAMNFIYRVQGA